MIAGEGQRQLPAQHGGAVAIGASPDLPAAIRSMTRIDHRLEPRPEFAETYDRLFAAYTALYPAVAPVMRPLAAMDGGQPALELAPAVADR